MIRKAIIAVLTLAAGAILLLVIVTLWLPIWRAYNRRLVLRGSAPQESSIIILQFL